MKKLLAVISYMLLSSCLYAQSSMFYLVGNTPGCSEEALELSAVYNKSSKKTTYTWQHNNLPLTTSSAKLILSKYNNGDVITCSIQADDSAETLTVSYTVSLTSNATVYVICNTCVNGTFCEDGSATFQSSKNAEGTVAWMVNDMNVGKGSNIILSNLKANDKVKAELTTRGKCATKIISNEIVIKTRKCS